MMNVGLKNELHITHRSSAAFCDLLFPSGVSAVGHTSNIVVQISRRQLFL